MTSVFLDIERDGVKIECEVEGSHQGPDPSVGIMGDYFEDICATRLDTKEPIELTEAEEEKAHEKLLDAYWDAGPDYEYLD